METAAAAPLAPPPLPQIVYADSMDSSPRSQHTDSWDSQPSSSFPASAAPPSSSAKLRLMCSYGGHIVPRPHDRSLCYLGGTTRIVVVDRSTSLSSLSAKLSSSLLDSRPFSLKYQLPNEDLDSLISISTDEDLENMIDEYDRLLLSSASSGGASPKSSCLRIRLFLFPASKPESASSIGSLLDDSKSENWFVDALNGAGILPRGHSTDSSSDINCLLGLDGGGGVGGPLKPPDSPSGKTGKPAADIQSVPDSPMMETASSFGSTSSASCLSNLPPIRVHVDEAKDPRLGLEDQFSQMNVGVGPPPMPIPTVEIPHRPAFSDDERSEHGLPGPIRKSPQPSSQIQQKLSSPELQSDPISRDSSNPANMNSHQKPGYYQDAMIPTSVADPMRDVSDASYRVPVPLQDQSYLLQEQQQQQQQQFLHAAPHYVHQHHATGSIPISSYYQMHLQQHPQMQQHQQHRLDQQYQMYFVPIGQNQAYNLPIQPNLGDTPPSIPTSKPPTLAGTAVAPASAPVYPGQPVPPSKAELPATMYRPTAPTTAQPLSTAAPFMHVSDYHNHHQQQQQQQQRQQQQQYMAYHQLHHTSQAAPSFSYEFTDPLQAQMYYTQQMATALAPQYQKVSSDFVAVPQMTAADAKQNRASQPL